MGAAIIEAFFVAFFLVFFILIGLAFLFTKRRGARIFLVKWITGIYFGPFVLFAFYEVSMYFFGQLKTLPVRKVFYTRCATAGEKIYKTADNVEGILLMNVRGASEYNDLYWPDAALPYEVRGDYYMRSFLTENSGDYFKNKGFIYKYYFNYVDVMGENENMRYRIDKEDGRKLKKEPSPPELARYAVSFVNDENTEDRKIGIAGTTIIVEDTFTGEKMAERTSYALSPQLSATGSVNWHKAITCPKNKDKYNVSRNFVTQVIKPKLDY